METILETIQRLKSDKEKKHISPVLVPLSELKCARMELLTDELNQLYKDKKIKIKRLINETAIV